MAGEFGVGDQGPVFFGMPFGEDRTVGRVDDRSQSPVTKTGIFERLDLTGSCEQTKCRNHPEPAFHAPKSPARRLTVVRSVVVPFGGELRTPPWGDLNRVWAIKLANDLA